MPLDPFLIALIVGLVQALILAAALVSRARHSVADQLFAALLIFLAVDLAYGVLIVGQYAAELPHATRIRAPLTFLYGPLLFLYVRIATGGRALKRSDLHHGLLALAIALYFIPLFFASATEKVTYLSGLYDGLGAESRVIGGVRRLQQGIYVWLAGSAILAMHKNVPRAWLAFLVTGFGLIWAVGVHRYIFDFTLLAARLDMALLAGYVIIAGFLAIRNPIWVRLESESSSRRTAKAQGVLARLTVFMDRDKPYRSRTLSLSDLAGELSIRPDELSAILNGTLGESFSDFINRHRVQDAMNRLQSEDGRLLKLSAIATECGFNSTSTFNAAFKKLSGVTPSHFRDTGQTTAAGIMNPVMNRGHLP